MSKQFSAKQLEALTLGALVTLYNQHSDKPIKKFRDKPTAVERVLAILPEEAPKKKPSGGPRGEGTPEIRRAAKKEQVEPREGTKRALLLKLLREGTTVEAIMEHEEIQWDRRTALEGIRIIHNVCGYGIEPRGGKLFATTGS